MIILLTWGASLCYSSPDDYQQGILVRIMYIHVPSAWIGMGGYMFITFFSILHIYSRNPFYFCIASAAGPVGAIFTLISLITGMIWGSATWGAWWVWDPRLTSTLILFFIYIAYIAVDMAGEYKEQKSYICSIIPIIGSINIPIVKYSVDLWHSLHQSSSFTRKSGVAIDPDMLKILVVVFIGLAVYCALIILMRLQNIILIKKLHRMKQIAH